MAHANPPASLRPPSVIEPGVLERDSRERDPLRGREGKSGIVGFRFLVEHGPSPPGLPRGESLGDATERRVGADPREGSFGAA